MAKMERIQIAVAIALVALTGLLGILQSRAKSDVISAGERYRTAREHLAYGCGANMALRFALRHKGLALPAINPACDEFNDKYARENGIE